MSEAPEPELTRPAPPGMVELCGFCGRDVIWLTLVNGRRRTFDAVEYRLLPGVDPTGMFAVRSRDRLAVELTTVARLPPWGLKPHRCMEFIEAMRDRQLGIGETLDMFALGQPLDDGRKAPPDGREGTRRPEPPRRARGGITDW